MVLKNYRVKIDEEMWVNYSYSERSEVGCADNPMDYIIDII